VIDSKLFTLNNGIYGNRPQKRHGKKNRRKNEAK